MLEGFGKSLISMLDRQKYINDVDMFYIDTEGESELTMHNDLYFHIWLLNVKKIDIPEINLNKSIFKKYYAEYKELMKIKEDFK